MDPSVLWFHFIPAIACIAVNLIGFVVWAPFVPIALRRRDWKMIAALAFTYLLFGGMLLVCINTVVHPPSP